MHLIKEKLDIEETLHKRIKNTLLFLNIKERIKKGNIISISNTNLAYIEPLKMIPIVNKKGINKVDSFGVIEIPIPPIRIIKS